MIDAPNVRDLLEKSPLFRGVPHKLLAPIYKQAMLISLDQGEQLLTPGVVNEHVYMIVSGQLSVHLTLENLDEPLTILNSGECVGEMSVLVDSIVSAYVIANTDCQLVAISYSSFWALIKGSNEAARNMISLLVKRIRMGNEVIADTLLQQDKLPEKKTIIDRLTGLFNQHGMQEKFDRMLHLCSVASQPLCLVMIKLDDAKNTPASHRELSDDQTLRAIAQLILTLLRPDDCAARLNGNTFAILLAQLTITDADAIAEKLRATVCLTPIHLPDGSALSPVTISAGVCKADEDDSWSTVIIKANLALERAIHAGRNRISE